MNLPSASGQPAPLGNETEAIAWRRRFELTAAAAGHVTYECNAAAGTILWSGSLTPVLGYALAEMQGGYAQWADLIHPEDRDKTLRALEESERSRGAYNEEYRFRHKAGHYVWIHDRGLRADDGALVGVMVDISERKRAEQALATSEARWRTVFAAAPYSIAINRLRDAVFLEVNPAFERLSGYRADEVLGKTSEALLALESHSATALIAEQLLRDRVVRQQEAVTLCKDGSRRDISYAAAVVEIEGEPCVISITEDITERKRVAQALQASEANYRHLFERNPAPMLVYERGSLQLLAVNEAFERHYGYSAAEVQAMRLTDLYPPEEQASIAALAATLKGHAYAGHWHHRKRDGTLIDIVARSHDILFDGRTGRIAVITDITERRKAEVALRVSEERFRKLIEASPVPIVVARGERLEYANAAYGRLVRLAPDEAVPGFPLLETVAPESREQVASYVAARRAGRAAPVHYEAVGLRRDGTRFPYEISVATIGLPDGPVTVAYIFDITERKQAEVELRENAARLRAITDSAQDAIVMMDPHGAISFWNPAAEKILGYRAEEAIGRPLHDLLAPERHLAAHRAALPEFLRTGQGQVVGQTLELAARRKDGQEISVALSLSAVSLGGAWHAVGILRDITERKRAEVALQASERLFRAVFEQAPHFIGVLDLQGNLLQVNQTASEFAHSRPQDVCGRPFWETPWWQHSAVEQARLQDAIARARQGEFIQFETTHPMPTGELRTVDFTLKPVRDETGQVVILIPEGRDITERKRAEEALSASEARYRSLVDEMKDAVYAIDTAGHILFVGPQVQQYGYTPEEVLGRDFLDFVLEEDRAAVQRNFGEELVIGRAKGSSFRIHTKSGAIAWVEDSGTVVRAADGRITGVSGILRDVTERKRAEVERQALQDQLIQAQKMEAVGQLAGGVAHDFNNILTAILMHLSLLREDHHLSPEIHAGLKELEGEARRAANLTRQLLMFSRRQVLQMQVLDLNSLLGNLLKMLRRLIGEHIVIEFSAAPGDLWVEADPGMLEQVVMNLVVNARDAMPSGGTVTLKSRLAVLDAAGPRSNPDARPGRFAQLIVVDTGCGMDADMRRHIFEPFFTTKEAGRGTGLGLATVYGIVNQHRGWVEVHSEVGRGSTFEVFLPASAQPVIKAVDEATLATLPRGRETLLVVEDEGSVRYTVVATLQRIGYRVFQAGSGPEALQTWTRHREAIDLLITDVVMPGGLSGLDLADRALAEKPGVRVILVSGYSLEMAKRGLPRSDSLRFLQKPFEAVTLARLVRASLDAR